jgi:hypothetical protein
VRAFIELTSPTSSVLKWAVNVDHIVMIRRTGHEDECQIQLVSGQISPAETYEDVMMAIHRRELTG